MNKEQLAVEEASNTYQLTADNGGLRKGYKQTAVGVIPEDWDVRHLLELSEIRTGIAKNSNISVSDPVIVDYLRVANVQDGFLNLSEISKIQVSRNDLRRYAVLPGDVLMNEGGDLDKLGRGALWQGEFNPCIHQNHVFVVRCNSTLSPEYLNNWTGTVAARRYFMVAGKQTTNLASINKTALGQLPIAFPPQSEQRAIATALFDVDALLAKLDQLITKKYDLKQAAMQQLLTGQTRLPGFSQEWVEKRLGDLCERITTGKLDANAMVRDGDYPFFTCAREHCWIDIFAFDTEALLVSGNGANVGYVHYYLGKFNAYQRTYVLSGFSCNIQFVKLFMERSLQDRIRVEVNAGNTPYIVMGTLTDMLVSLPISSEEQTAIATILSDMDAEITTLEVRRDKTRDIKQGMMQELMTGRIRLI